VITPTLSASGSSESPKKVIVGMSGGVDSSVSAYLLQQAGHEVSGLFMKNWEEDDGTEYCTAQADLADAQSVCDSLGIELLTANFAAEYWDNVFEHFLAEYRSGRTPNPDVLCNREIKFKAFLDYAYSLGADCIATGHYVQRVDEGSRSYLHKGVDVNKDQTYFLCEITEENVGNTLFPIGNLEKSEVRRIAADLQLATSRKKDSTGICFIGERKFKDFLSTYLPAQPGRIESLNGEFLGEHGGLMYYTLGQRQGLGIGGRAGCAEEPWYVVAKDLSHNLLIVAQGNENNTLYSRSVTALEGAWIDQQGPDFPFRCHAKLRYRQPDQPCHVSQDTAGKLKVLFDAPQRAVTPGQYVVFYDGERCLGGAVVDSYER
jgi:tRNA-specific 2-thiouridylase